MDNRIALKNGYILKTSSSLQYQITSEIGRGASCIVYEGNYLDSLGLHHKVRIKESYPHFLTIQRSENGYLTAEQEELFNKEKNKFLKAYEESVHIREISGLVNSSINATNFFEWNNTEYIVTEYHEGSTYDTIKEQDLEELLTTALAIARVIRGYNNQELLYLDLKPANVLILPESREHVVLFDFDSLINVHELKEGKGVDIAVSDGYAAPEQKTCDLRKIGFYTDIYCLGVLVFEKLFHRFPTLLEMSLNHQYDFSAVQYIDHHFTTFLK